MEFVLRFAGRETMISHVRLSERETLQIIDPRLR